MFTVPFEVMLQTVREIDSLFTIVLKVDTFRVNYKPICKGEKVVFYLLVDHLLGHSLTYMSPSKISHSALYVPCLDPLEPVSVRAGLPGLRFMSLVLDLVTGLWLLTLEIISMFLLPSGYVLIHLELTSLGKEFRYRHEKCNQSTVPRFAKDVSKSSCMRTKMFL